MSSSRRKLVVHPQAEGDDFATRVTAASGSITDAQLAAINRFVYDLKSADVWNKIQDCGLLCGEDLDAALVKLKYTSGDGLLVNTGFTASEFDIEGLTGDGDGMSLATGFKPGADYHLAVWAGAHTRDAQLRVGIGADDRLLGRDASDDIIARYAASAGYLSADEPTITGLWIQNCPPGACELWLNANKVNETTGLDAPAALVRDISIFASDDGDGPEDLWLGTIGFYSIGYSLSAGDVAALWNALTLFYATLGRTAATA